eukprot:symbB.v1.2.027975.t1/scaffold2911.1/size132876/3
MRVLSELAEEAAKNQDTLERERAAIQAQEEASAAAEDATRTSETQTAAETELVKATTGSLKSVVERLQEQVTMELKAKELLDIEAEEVILKLEDDFDNVVLLDSDADRYFTVKKTAGTDRMAQRGAMIGYFGVGERPISSNVQREALWSYYKSHRAEIVQLQRRKAVLERANASQTLPQKKNAMESHEDVSTLKRAVEQLSAQNDHLTHALASKNKFLEEQRYLQKTGLDMLETQRELEVCLAEEIASLQACFAREEQLAQLARELCQIRDHQKQQRQLQRAEVARLQSRLHMLRSGGRQFHAFFVGKNFATGVAELEEEEEGEEGATGPTVDPRSMELETLEVREDAGLGSSFDSICGLYRCYHKAQILSRSIHEHCVAKAALVQDRVMRWRIVGNSPDEDPQLMRFLCSAELVGSQLAYAVIGVLSCLQSTEVSKYVELSQLSSLASAAQVGEMGVDALLRPLGVFAGTRSFLQICRGQDDSSTAQREAMLAAVRAQGAQLMSLQKVTTRVD